MDAADAMRTIEQAKATGRARLRLVWSDGAQANVDLGAWLERPAFATLRDPAEFAKVEIGDWGHCLVWPARRPAPTRSGWRPSAPPAATTPAPSWNGACATASPSPAPPKPSAFPAA
jgi:hypothetical protein